MLYDEQIKASADLKLALAALPLAHLRNIPIGKIKEGFDLFVETIGENIDNNSKANVEEASENLARINRLIEYKIAQLKITEAELKNANERAINSMNNLDECQKKNAKFNS